MLTLKQLMDMPPHTVFARGEIVDSPEGLNMSNSGRTLKWIAKRGEIHDWAIYTHFADRSWDYVRTNGDKVTSESDIKMLVPCDDEAFGMFRY